MNRCPKCEWTEDLCLCDRFPNAQLDTPTEVCSTVDMPKTKPQIDTPKTAGPAFPVQAHQGVRDPNCHESYDRWIFRPIAGHAGMTLRAWLTGQALSGLCVNTGAGATSIAEQAVEIADAAIKELGL